MATNNREKPAPMHLGGGGENKVTTHKVRKPPKLLVMMLYGVFTWVTLGALMYTTGFLSHKGDDLDTFFSFSIGLGGPVALILLYLFTLWFE